MSVQDREFLRRVVAAGERGAWGRVHLRMPLRCRLGLHEFFHEALMHRAGFYQCRLCYVVWAADQHGSFPRRPDTQAREERDG